MNIGFSDVVWNYIATFLRIASSVLLLPFILRIMPAETVGVWTIFVTVTSFIGILDFGFNPTFTRNITYVFSGVRELKSSGYSTTSAGDVKVDFGLLKGVINSMRWFYTRISILLFLILMTLGTYYIHNVLQHYSGNHTEAYIAWFVLCTINTYSFYTLYYESLLQGKGLVKLSKQIVIAGQIVYLTIAAALLLSGQGLIAIVAAQASSVIIVRSLSYHLFFTKELKEKLCIATTPYSDRDILKTIYPNAIKIGLTILGGLSVSRSAILIGSLYFSLTQIASYGITMQLISVISSLAAIYTSTYLPKISQYRVHNNLQAIKYIYIKGQLMLISTYIIGGISLIFVGEWLLYLINSKTVLMSRSLVVVAIVITLLENNHSVAGSILLTGNKVPFFKASLVAGAVTIVLLLVFIEFTDLGLISLLLAPGLAHLYNNWKWPYEVIKQLNISIVDIKQLLKADTKLSIG